MAFSFNELELQVFEKYCKKYKVKNKSKFFREAVIASILKKFDDDYPTLFSESEMDDMLVKKRPKQS